MGVGVDQIILIVEAMIEGADGCGGTDFAEGGGGTAAGTFDLVAITAMFPTLSQPLTVYGLPITLPIETVKAIAFWAFVIAFAIKVPIWPFHTWLPDAHTEAPTAGSMIPVGRTICSAIRAEWSRS